jgi:hypothetical protein
MYPRCPTVSIAQVTHRNVGCAPREHARPPWDGRARDQGGRPPATPNPSQSRGVRHARNPPRPCPLALSRPSRLRTAGPARRRRIAAGRPPFTPRRRPGPVDLGAAHQRHPSRRLRGGGGPRRTRSVAGRRTLLAGRLRPGYRQARSGPPGRRLRKRSGPDPRREPRHRLDRPAPPRTRNVRDRGALVPPGRLAGRAVGREGTGGRAGQAASSMFPPGGSSARPPGGHSG